MEFFYEKLYFIHHHMKITEILQLEQKNQNQIILIKEGCFWRAYEKSAFRFSYFIQDYKITKKWIKNLDKEIVLLGFPLNALEKIEKKIKASNLEILQREESLIKIGNCVQKVGFAKWKMSIEKIIPKNHKHIFDSIRKFPTLNKTPLEAIEFLMQLQSEIKRNY